MHRLQRFLRQRIPYLQRLQAQETHVFLPPRARHVVVGVRCFAQPRPEHILRGVLLCPTVVVVGIHISQHTLSRARDEVVAAAYDTPCIARTLEEHIDIHTVPRQVTAEAIHYPRVVRSAYIALVFLVNLTVVVHIDILDITRAHHGTQLRRRQGRQQFTRCIEILCRIEPIRRIAIQRVNALPRLTTIGALDALRLVYLQNGVLCVGKGPAQRQLQPIGETVVVSSRQVYAAVVHLTEVGIRSADESRLRRDGITLHEDVAAQLLEEVHLQVKVVV